METQVGRLNIGLSTESLEHFFPIRPGALRPETVTKFDLYFLPDKTKPLVLYRERSVPFSQEAKVRLDDLNIDYLYVNRAQEDSFQRYVQSHIGAILNDDSVPIPIRSELAYYSAQSVVQELFSSPRAGDLVHRAESTVTSTMRFMLNEPSAVTNLIKVMSFDYYTYTHSVNVFVLSMGLAQRVGFTDEEELKEFGDGTLLHDIGKSLLPQELVTFPGKYTEAQFAEMKKHPVLGYELLYEQGSMSELGLDVVRHHHEKLRGGGYPDNLSGEDIEPLVRICTIADIFDALTTDRCYQRAKASFDALQLMKREILPDLDPQHFRAFIEMLQGTDSGTG